MAERYLEPTSDDRREVLDLAASPFGVSKDACRATEDRANERD